MEGMLYPLLFREIKLTLGRVARKHCQVADRLYDATTDICPYCQRSHFEPGRDAIVAERLLVIPGSTGPYWLEPWWHCASCPQSPRQENYFRCINCWPRPEGGIHHKAPEDCCPLCMERHVDKPSWLYVH